MPSYYMTVSIFNLCTTFLHFPADGTSVLKKDILHFQDNVTLHDWSGLGVTLFLYGVTEGFVLVNCNEK